MTKYDSFLIFNKKLSTLVRDYCETFIASITECVRNRSASSTTDYLLIIRRRANRLDGPLCFEVANVKQRLLDIGCVIHRRSRLTSQTIIFRISLYIEVSHI